MKRIDRPDGPVNDLSNSNVYRVKSSNSKMVSASSMSSDSSLTSRPMSPSAASRSLAFCFAGFKMALRIFCHQIFCSDVNSTLTIFGLSAHEASIRVSIHISMKYLISTSGSVSQRSASHVIILSWQHQRRAKINVPFSTYNDNYQITATLSNDRYSFGKPFSSRMR